MRDKGIDKESARLVEMDHEVRALEGRQEQAFTDYLRSELKNGKVAVKKGPEGIQLLIDDARVKLEQGDTGSAIRLASEAELLIERLKDIEKQTFEYDLRDLKTSIKLAML